MIRSVRTPVLALTLLVVAGCASRAEEDLVGACFIDEREPALTVTTVTDAETGAPVTGVRVRVQGAPSASSEPTPCVLPCAVEGISDGPVRIRVAAPGYRPRTVRADAGWTSGEGGCPGWVDDGATVTVALDATGGPAERRVARRAQRG